MQFIAFQILVRLAQLVKQRTDNPEAGCWSPPSKNKFFNGFRSDIQY